MRGKLSKRLKKKPIGMVGDTVTRKEFARIQEKGQIKGQSKKKTIK